LLKSVQKTNSLQVPNLISIIKKKIYPLRGKKIAILGLSFKEDSDDIRYSASFKLINLLMKEKVNVIVHDPMAINNTKKVFGSKILYANSIRTALKNRDCVIIMTPWKQYEQLKNSDFDEMREKIIIDTRRILSKKKLKAEYLAIGLGS